MEELKSKFEQWSGFTLESETLEDILAEIDSRKYQLECEVSDAAKGLRRMAEKIFSNKTKKLNRL